MLEAMEVIVRGDVRARLPIASLVDAHVDGDDLACTVEGVDVRFALGAGRATSWVAALAAPPPSLAKKLGISATTRVAVVGDLDDAALRDALGAAAPDRISADAFADAELVVVRSDDADEIAAILARAAAATARPPLWIVYRKGRAAPLGETRLRALMREGGWTDTKVAAVSSTLTALRFAYRGT